MSTNNQLLFQNGGEALLSASKLSTVAAGKEVITTPLGNKFGKPGQLKTDLKDGIGIGVGVSATSAAAVASRQEGLVDVLRRDFHQSPSRRPRQWEQLHRFERASVEGG